MMVRQGRMEEPMEDMAGDIGARALPGNDVAAGRFRPPSPACSDAVDRSTNALVEPATRPVGAGWCARMAVLCG